MNRNPEYASPSVRTIHAGIVIEAMGPVQGLASGREGSLRDGSMYFESMMPTRGDGKRGG